MTLIWPSLIILHSPTSKLIHTMLHFTNTSSDRSLSDILALFGHSTMPPWLKILSTGALEAGMANVRRTAGISLSYVALLRTQKSTSSESQSPSVARKYLAKSLATETSVAVSLWCSMVCMQFANNFYLFGGGSFLHRFTRPQRSSLLQCYRSCKYKGLEKGLAGRASKSKSKSIAFKSKSESLEPKSKSSKNGLKSGLESKSGLEYYKSVIIVHRGP